MSTPTLTSRQRKATGAYYTPPQLVDLLLNHLPLPASGPFRILDPAAGQGDLLVPLLHRLRGHPHLIPQIHAIDINQQALSTSQKRLHNVPDPSFACADALLHPPTFLKPQSFDLVLANPPYVNAIESLMTPDFKQRLRDRFPNVRGAADLALYFLDQATRLVKPGGRIAFILPRAILNSPAAAGIRENLPPLLKPNLIYAPERCDFFPGAAVFICLLILGPEESCLVSTDEDPSNARFRETRITSSNWWNALHGESAASPTSSTPLHHHFQLSASMTAADAYDALPHLVDDPAAPGQRFITTGLINPRENLWGARTCRYLRRTFNHPRLPDNRELTRSLARRLAQSHRPKILLAGLAKRLEAFLDESGQCIGAVSTFSIYHPTDDVAALRGLLDHLLSPAATEHLVAHLAANALRGRHITLKKTYLLDVPIPTPLGHK